MKVIKIFAILLAATAIASCSDDDITASKPLTLSVPIELIVSNPLVDGTRATGDPGYDDELQPPAYVYLFAWVQVAANKYDMIYTSRTGLTKNDWTYSLGTDKEDADSRYKLNNNVELTFKSSALMQPAGTEIGRIYAIATTKQLTDTQLQEITSAAYSSVLTSTAAIEFGTSPDNTLKDATVALAGWTSTDLRDLYSNPAGDTSTGANGVGNGRMVFDSNGIVKFGDIRLYHCAAKIDFTWEVPAALRSTTQVERLTVKNLPTSCKVFKPTENPATPATTHVITTTMETKWLGREYFYALQPGNGTITYDVDFQGKTNITGNTFTPLSVNPTFTGWYRVIAKIANP